ncbi:hypothetical protein AB0C76_33035 [Kitasatospora sp. NPDC048722]|uniref:hypothetical protein n=1 Tax=Kitasatospora sp. NPDC048722 TaxID=3155639 RepID=UPI0033D82FBE
MADNSVYNDPAYDITSVPSWKTPPLHGAYAPNARLTPRMKVGLAGGAVVLVATGMVTWSQYASAEAAAEVKKAQIALDASRLDLERQKQQAADQAKAADQETAAQKARREAVQACVDRAAGAYNAVADCGKAFPQVDSPGMVNTSQRVAGGDSDSGAPVGGLVVLGGAGALLAAGWAKKRYARS